MSCVFKLLAEFYQDHRSMIFRYLYRRTGSYDLAEELTQETFYQAVLSIAGFRGESGVRTWLYRIAYNVWYDYCRRHKMTDDLDTPQVNRQVGENGDRNLNIDLYKALQILTERERLCITLQLMEGQPIERISEISGMKPNTVKSHLLRGKEKLANYLRQNGYDRKG